MISLTKVRELDLSVPTVFGRRHHLSAASGLVRLGSFIYVVADDELHLGVFRTTDSRAGDLIRIFDGALPEFTAARKKEKPDLEVLMLLPEYEAYPHGALLALGSGSRPNRRTGVLLGLDTSGAVQTLPQVVDFSDFLAPLDNAFHALNIEGGVVSGSELRLFQRGNKRDGANAIIRYQLSFFLDALSSAHIKAIAPSAIDYLDLGQIDGIPFSVTDAAALPDGSMIFTAVAEDTDNPYNDGPCIGAAIGVVSNDGKLRCLRRLDRPYKVEGVDARVEGDVLRLLLVTDADDSETPAVLFSATMER